MAVAVLIIELLILIVVCGLVLRIFASFKKTPWYAIASTWLGWILCFAIALLLPIDIVNADHEDCLKDHNNNEHDCSEPIAYLDKSIMIAQWRALYWGTLLMSWLGFPLLQTYSLAGDFTPWEKMVRSIKENIYIYIGMAIVGTIFLITLAASRQLTGTELLSLVMALANAYGLILVTILMSYGLVDIPRYLFRKASRQRMLVHYHAQVTKLKETMDSAKEDLDKTLRRVKKVAERVKDSDPYRPYVDVILQKCPLAYDDVAGDGEIGDITYEKLVSLNARVADDTHAVARAVCLYEVLLRKAFAIEDIIKLKETGGSPDHKIHYSFRQPRPYKYAYIVDTIEYFWELYLHPMAYYVMGFGAVILSVLIVWCEITLVVNKDAVDLSPFSQIIKHSDLDGFGKQLFCFIPLSYMALCAYTTLFKIKIFNYYRLVPHQQSDANSIMFSANYMCRLAAPLSYNFLNLIDQTDSSFSEVMGQMDAFNSNVEIGKKFGVIFPIFVAVFCVLSILNAWSKMSAMCCIKKLRYIPDDDYRLITDGENILQAERDIKDGHGPTNQSFKENLKSTIQYATRKNNNKHNIKDEETGNAKPLPIPISQAEMTATQKLRAKYSSSSSTPASASKSYEDGADIMVPPSSRFGSMNTSSSMATDRHRASSSTTSHSNMPSFSANKSRATDDELLPATSRFSSGKNSAIVDMIHDEPVAARSFVASTQSNTSSQKSSIFGSLFGSKKSKNDEIGLLSRD